MGLVSSDSCGGGGSGERRLSDGGGGIGLGVGGGSAAARRSGITARAAGQPRGVIQFLPSVKKSEFMSKTAYETYLANKNRMGSTGTAAGGQPGPVMFLVVN